MWNFPYHIECYQQICSIKDRISIYSPSLKERLGKIPWYTEAYFNGQKQERLCQHGSQIILGIFHTPRHHDILFFIFCSTATTLSWWFFSDTLLKERKTIPQYKCSFCIYFNSPHENIMTFQLNLYYGKKIRIPKKTWVFLHGRAVLLIQINLFHWKWFN